LLLRSMSLSSFCLVIHVVPAVLLSSPTRRSSDLQAARAAQVIVGVDVARTERATFVAPHGTNAPGIDVLDDREGLAAVGLAPIKSEEHTSELQSRENLVCRLLLEKKNH